METSRKRHLPRKTLAIACALAFATPAVAGDFSNTLYFGDSLTDSGTFGSKFTTNPGPVWSEIVANRLGTLAMPASTGGSNFAVGGARVSQLPGVPNSPPTDTAPPIVSQIDAYLSGTGGAADRAALYTVWGGANDLFVSTALGAGAPAYLAQTADELAAQIGRLQAAGARVIVVPNLPDIGATPFGTSQGAAGAAALTQLSVGYNSALHASIAARGVHVVAADIYTFFNEVLANPAAYGIANVGATACGATPSLLCTNANLVSVDAAQTYLFADGVHPTSAGHGLIAAYVESILAAPAQISMLPETAVRTRAAFVDRLYVRLADATRSPAGGNLWVTVEGDHVSLDSQGIASDARGGGAGVTVGADLWRGRGAVLGAALGFSTLKPRFGNGGDYRQEETTAAIYGRWGDERWHVNGALSYGALQYDVRREIQLGAATRDATGSPSGTNLSFGVEAGYRFTNGPLSHGPLAGFLLQRAKVDGFSEDGAGSAGLRYAEQQRSSSIGRLGWQFGLDAGRWQPYARISVERELRDRQRDVDAQVVTASDVPMFSMPAISVDRNLLTALVGTGVQLAPRWSANVGVAYSSGSHTSVGGAFATLSTTF